MIMAFHCVAPAFLNAYGRFITVTPESLSVKFERISSEATLGGRLSRLTISIALFGFVMIGGGRFDT
jgi:hypothetical protein